MAKKKAGNAAGLAALAGLAYMASQGKEGKGDSSYDTLESKRLSRKAETETAPIDVPIESGDFLSRRLNRTDTDDGRAYSTNNLSPMSSPAPASRAPATTRAASSYLTSPASGVGNPSENQPYRAPGGVGKRTGSGTIPVDIPVAQNFQAPKEAAPAASKSGFGGPIYYPPPQGQADDANIDKDAYNKFLEKRPGIMQRMREKDRAAAGSTMKKGGAVKKMASGGMTSSVSSASRRADGIAVKGKTRGKMY